MTGSAPQRWTLHLEPEAVLRGGVWGGEWVTGRPCLRDLADFSFLWLFLGFSWLFPGFFLAFSYLFPGVSWF